MRQPTWTKALGLVVLSLLLLAPPMLAQTTGRVSGTVVDDQGAPIPGVTVTLSSPALLGDRTEVTDSTGSFRFLGLAPSGDYTLTGTLEGFNTIQQESIRVSLGGDSNLQLEMSSAFSDEIVVRAEAPVVDHSSTTSGANFSEEMFSDLPVGRSYQNMAFAAPGVVSGGLGSNPSIGGASAAENRYVINGLDTTDPGFGTIGAELAFEFIQEVEVKTGGYEAEYGGALGGILNVVTKSGSNEFHGDVFGYFTDDSLQEEVPPTATFGQDLGFTEYDYGVDAGGKIIQDKLWYFAALNPQSSEEIYTSRGGANYAEQVDTLTYAGKLTFQANPNNQLYLSIFGEEEEQENIGIRNSIGFVANNSDDSLINGILGYNGAISSSLFIEASAGRYDLQDSDSPVVDTAFYEDRTSGTFWIDETNCQGASIPNTTTVFHPGCVGGTFAQLSGDRSRDEVKGAASYFLQTGPLDHELKVGAQWRDVEYHDNARYPGPVSGARFDEFGTPIQRASNGFLGQRYLLFNSFYILLDYRQDSVGTTEETSLFLQDQMRIGDYLTLNLGVRADASDNTGARTAAFPNSALDFSFSDQVAPRVGLTWDVARNGKSKLFAHYGKFYESVPLDINVRAFGNETFEFFYFFYPSDGSLPTADNLGEFWFDYPLGVGVGVAEGIEPMYTEEIVAGFEYEVIPNLAVGLKYITRDINNVIEDISVDGGHTYFITNPGACFGGSYCGPGGSYTHNPVTGELLGHEDDDGVFIEEPVTFPEAEREYEAIELTINKRFSNNWQMGGSYVNSENIGNYGGLFRQDNGQLDPNITSLFDLPSLLNGAYGLLPNDREHQAKLFGSYVWPFKLVTGFYGQYLSGTPISKLGAHPIYGRRERFITPRGTEGRTDDVWNVDLHLEYPISFGGALNLRVIADVFNISDEQTATTVDQEWTFAGSNVSPNPSECGGTDAGCAGANPNFGTPLSYQTPRTFRFGAKLSW